MPPPSSSEPTFVRLFVLGGLNKNFGQPSVNTFSEDFFRIFGNETDGKNRACRPRIPSRPVFRPTLRAGRAEQELRPFLRQSLFRRFFGFFSEKTAERTEALASFIAPRRRCFWPAVSRREAEHGIPSIPFKTFLKNRHRRFATCLYTVFSMPSKIQLGRDFSFARFTVVRKLALIFIVFET